MFKNNLKIAFRNLLKNKTYGALNMAGLALSLSCGILIFLLVQFHLSFDHFHKTPERIYRFVTEQHRDNISYAASVPPPFGKAFRSDYDFGEQVARTVVFDDVVSVQSGNEVKKFKEPAGVSFTEPGFFDIFRFPLLQGNQRTILSEPNTAVITEKIAHKYFGNENPVNKVLRVGDKVSCTIAGVLRDLPANTDLQSEVFVSWPTLKTYNEWFAADDSWGGMSSSLQCFVRLKPGVSPQQVEKLLPAYVKKYRAQNKNIHHYKLQPLREMHFDGRYGGVMEKRYLWILSFTGLFLIAAACVNFINLATAQALKRSKEVGIRKVLGGLRRQLFWQFIAETALITVVATVVSVGLCCLLLPYVNEWFKTAIQFHWAANWPLLLFIFSLMLLVTFLAGAYPGLILSGFRPVTALKGKLSLQHIGGFNTRRMLIVTQFAISLVLIIGMMVITRQMQYAKQSDLGFNKNAVVMVPLAGDSVAPVLAFKKQLLNLAGVEKVSLCFAAPSSEANWNNSVRFDNRSDEEPFKVSIKGGDDQYVPAFGLQLVAGRNMFPSDSAGEMLVNETMVRKLSLSSPQEAIGKSIILNGRPRPATIVGVVKDFHDRSFHEDINAVGIISLPETYQAYAIKINLQQVTGVLQGIEQTWNAVFPNSLYECQFLDEKIAAFYETEEMMLKLIKAFSFIAIFIGCLGLYGLVTFLAAQKTKEIGIRKVLGSSIAEILWIFGKEFAMLILIAFLVAAPVAAWLMHNWLQDFKYHIALSAWFFVLAMAVSLLIVLCTVGYQSIRAALANPVKSLRSE
jgi:predicted permease